MSGIKGYQVFWDVALLQTTRKELEDLGFGAYLPENSYKSRLKRACKMATNYLGEKDEDNKQNYTFKQIKNVNPVCSSYEIAEIKSTYSQETETGGAIKYRRVCQITVNRLTGVLTSTSDDLFAEEISKNYVLTEDLVDTQEFLKLVRSYLKDACFRINLRPSGGVYYVDESRKAELDKLVELFSNFPHAKLHMTTIMDDLVSRETVQEATFRELDQVLEDLKRDVSYIPKSKKITETAMSKREEKIANAKALLNEHYKNLDGRRTSLEEAVNKLEKVCREVEWNEDLNAVSGDDFLKLLRESSI